MRHINKLPLYSGAWITLIQTINELIDRENERHSETWPEEEPETVPPAECAPWKSTVELEGLTTQSPACSIHGCTNEGGT